MESYSNLTYRLVREHTVKVFPENSIIVSSILHTASRQAWSRVCYLELRRLRFDLINYYKVLNGLSPFDPLYHFLIHLTISSSRSSVPYLLKPSRCNSKLFSFFYRHVDVSNSFPGSELFQNCIITAIVQIIYQKGQSPLFKG